MGNFSNSNITDMDFIYGLDGNVKEGHLRTKIFKSFCPIESNF